MKSIITLTFLLLLALNINAAETKPSKDETSGFNRGNGGNIIICYENDVVTYRLLDFFEGEHNWRFTTDKIFLDQSLSYAQIVEMVLNRFEETDVILGQKLRTYYYKLKESSELLPDHVFVDTNDQGNYVIPASCALAQGAIQWITPPIGMKHYIFNGHYWHKISNLDKAGLIIHEIIYKAHIEQMLQFSHPYGEINSYNIRYYVAYLFSDDFGRFN